MIRPVTTWTLFMLLSADLLSIAGRLRARSNLGCSGQRSGVKGLAAIGCSALIVSATFSDFVNFRYGYGFLQIDLSHLATVVWLSPLKLWQFFEGCGIRNIHALQ
jgi:hypothetical protein